MANPNFYNVALRDKDGYLKKYLTPYAKAPSWEWNRIGGCGRAQIKLGMPYRDITYNARDDIQIRLRNPDYRLRSNADIDSEDMTVITDWTDGDSGGGVSSQVTFDGKSCMKLDSGLDISGNDDYARRYQDIGSFGARTVFSMKMYFDAIGSTSASNYFLFMAFNGTTVAYIYFGSDGLFIHNGATAVEVGSDLVVQGTWQEWTFDVNWTAQTVDVYLDSVLKASGVDCSYASGLANGSVYFDQYGFTIANQITYIDWFKAGSDFDTTITPSKLVYRGWISGVTPSLKTSQEITLDVRGYFDLLDFLIVHDAGAKKTYTNQSVSSIVTNIIDTFVVPNTPITKGTIDDANFSVDTIEFKCKVSEALKTLAELEGGIEYGVDEDLNFFWRKQSETLRKKFFVGVEVTEFERKIDWSKLMNKIYFEGGDVGGSPYILTLPALDSQVRYFVAEGIVTQTSITTPSVASQYLNAKIMDSARLKLILRAKIPNTTLRLEDTLPIGRIGIYDKDYDQLLHKWGTTANGGDNLIWGRKSAGGSGGVWGALFKDQIDRISYSLSDTEERFNIELTTGGSLIDFAAKIKQIELLLSNLRQNQ